MTRRGGGRHTNRTALESCLTLAVLMLVWVGAASAQIITAEVERVRPQLEAIPIGETRDVTVAAGDGCNTCHCQVTRVSEDEVQWPIACGCTLANCRMPHPEKFK